MQYSLPYIVFSLFLALLAIIKHQQKEDEDRANLIEKVGIAMFFAFFAFRGYIWHDWTAYYSSFENLEWDSIASYEYSKFKEPLWMLFVLVCKTILPVYQVMVIIHSGLSTFLLVRFFRQYGISVLLGLALFTSFNGYELMINLMRNSLSILIFLNSLSFIEHRKFWPYILMCLLASCFHVSAIVYFVLYFFLNRKMNKWLFLGLVILANVLVFARVSVLFSIVKLVGIENEIIDKKLEAYSDYGLMAVSRFVLLWRFVVSILIFCYYEKLIDLCKSNVIFMNSFVVYLLGISLTAEFTELSNRIGFLFVYSIWILLGYLVSVWHYRRNMYLYIGFVTIMLAYNTLVCTGEYLKRYQNFLLGNADTYEERIKDYNKYFEEPDQL